MEKSYQDAVHNAGLPVIVFGASDVNAARKELESRGVKFRDDLSDTEWGIKNVLEVESGNYIISPEHDHGR